jgi:hypothetical protein
MKHLIIGLFTFIYFNSFSQTFNGTLIDGTLPEFVSKMKLKGFTLKKQEGNSAVMEGNDKKELYIFSTPKSKKVFRITVYLPESTSWYNLKSEYFRYKELLTNINGTPHTNYEFFSNPYYEGDGYELQAVSLEKVTYSSYWFKDDQNSNVSVTISKYAQVQLIYENIKNNDINKNEKNEIEMQLIN